MKYIFEYLNNGLEITDPTITINSYGNELDTPTIIYASITLTTDGVKFGVDLDNIKVNDRNFNESQLMERVLTRLNDFSTDAK